ncbi:MAG: glycosyl hydrolase family 28-related protein [Gammaproteobacteria bacterium]|nr:glycosyl hydrolase family 28-related protein [Gammaproteobacteria bacterium]MCY4165003.1 glycosyl hydrolase family 28-related protein [Gammaproteobacteria bacterium]MCY4340229.1 glycosyl hydrolase family 28-related protein [Gammaproteobacteria bacterium]
MIYKRLLPPFGVVLLILSLSALVADQSRNELPALLSIETIKRENYLPDFSFAGYGNGLAAMPDASGTVIEVDDFGASANDQVDDTQAVLAAIAHANGVDGPVIVRFSTGRYIVSGVMKIERSDFVLQGAGSGAGGTVLYFPRPLKQVDRSASLDELRKYLVELDKREFDPDRNLNDYFSEYSWSGGFIWIQKPGMRAAPYLVEYDPEIEKLADIEAGARGARTITLASVADIDPGDIIQLQWINRAGPDAGIIKSLYGAEYRSAGSHHWSFPERPLVRQTSRVLRVDGRNVQLADPLLHDANDAIPAQVAAWDGLRRVGIEDIRLEFPDSPFFGHHLERGYNGIYFTSSFDSWVRNIRITNADSGILSYNSASLTYKDVITDGARRAHYAVHMGNVHNVLAENITIMNPVLHSLSFNTQSTKCVFKNAEVFVSPALDQHAGANHQNLFDNVTLHMRAVRSDDGPVVAVFDGSGAGYWQPGHGGFNTTWNLRVLITGGAYANEAVTVQGLDEGPMARIVGLHGNREFKLDYRPAPYVERLNQPLESVPSLYEYQRRERLVVNPHIY